MASSKELSYLSIDYPLSCQNERKLVLLKEIVALRSQQIYPIAKKKKKKEQCIPCGEENKIYCTKQ